MWVVLVLVAVLFRGAPGQGIAGDTGIVVPEVVPISELALDDSGALLNLLFANETTVPPSSPTVTPTPARTAAEAAALAYHSLRDAQRAQRLLLNASIAATLDELTRCEGINAAMCRWSRRLRTRRIFFRFARTYEEQRIALDAILPLCQALPADSARCVSVIVQEQRLVVGHQNQTRRTMLSFTAVTSTPLLILYGVACASYALGLGYALGVLVYHALLWRFSQDWKQTTFLLLMVLFCACRTGQFAVVIETDFFGMDGRSAATFFLLRVGDITLLVLLGLFCTNWVSAYYRVFREGSGTPRIIRIAVLVGVACVSAYLIATAVAAYVLVESTDVFDVSWMLVGWTAFALSGLTAVYAVFLYRAVRRTPDSEYKRSAGFMLLLLSVLAVFFFGKMLAMTIIQAIPSTALVVTVAGKRLRSEYSDVWYYCFAFLLPEMALWIALLSVALIMVYARAAVRRATNSTPFDGADADLHEPLTTKSADGSMDASPYSDI